MKSLQKKNDCKAYGGQMEKTLEFYYSYVIKHQT